MSEENKDYIELLAHAAEGDDLEAAAEMSSLFGRVGCCGCCAC